MATVTICPWLPPCLQQSPRAPRQGWQGLCPTGCPLASAPAVCPLVCPQGGGDVGTRAAPSLPSPGAQSRAGSAGVAVQAFCQGPWFIPDDNLLITARLPPAVAVPVSWQGPAGMGRHWHPVAFLCHGKARCCQGHEPALALALPISAALFPVGLAMLSVTHTISKELTSSKACCGNLAPLRLPPSRDMQRLGRYSNRSELYSESL